MKEPKVLLDDRKSYHVGELLANFEYYFGLSFEELSNLFSNYKIIEKEEVKQYIIENKEKLWETKINEQALLRKEKYFHNSEDIAILPIDLNKIIEERLLDYEILYQSLIILAHKGNNYLKLLEYVANLKDIFHEDEFYELMFDYLNISHYGKGMTGEHLKQILIPLTYIIKEIQYTITRINNLENYHMQQFDSFARTFGEDEIYSQDSIIYNDDSYIVDKTSIYLPQKRNLKRSVAKVNSSLNR